MATMRPWRPSSRISRGPSQRVLTTGVPQAIASTSALQNPSQRELTANTAACRMKANGLSTKPGSVAADAERCGQRFERRPLFALAEDHQPCRALPAHVGEGADQRGEVLGGREAPDAEKDGRSAWSEPFVRRPLMGQLQQPRRDDRVVDPRDGGARDSCEQRKIVRDAVRDRHDGVRAGIGAAHEPGQRARTAERRIRRRGARRRVFRQDQPQSRPSQRPGPDRDDVAVGQGRKQGVGLFSAQVTNQPRHRGQHAPRRKVDDPHAVLRRTRLVRAFPLRDHEIGGNALLGKRAGQRDEDTFRATAAERRHEERHALHNRHMPIGRLRKHRTFIGQVGTIVSGRGIAAGIGLLLTPVVARLYSPDDFGLAALFFAIAAIAVQVASLKYESAIALPREDGEALRIATLSYRLVPASCVLLFVAIAVLQLAGSGAGRASQLGHWLWMLPLTVFLMAEQDVLESWLYRQLRFGVVSRSAVIDVSVAQGSRIAFGALGGSSVAGLIVGQLLGVVARLVVQGRAGWQSLAAAIRRAEPGTLRTVAARYSDFAKLSAPAALLNVSNQNLPVILFAAIFSPAVAGFFAMANRLTKAPIQIGSDSVRRVFLQRAARIH
jgi:hypothetical protein